MKERSRDMIDYEYRELSVDDIVRYYTLAILGFSIGVLVLVLSIMIEYGVLQNILRMGIGFIIGLYWAILVRFVRNIRNDEYIYLRLGNKSFKRVKLKDMPDEIFLKVFNNRRRGL